MRIPVLGMLHQAGHGAPQRRPRGLRDDVLDRLAELQRPLLRRRLHGEIIPEAQHGGPAVAVEIVDGAAGADEEIVLVAEGPQCRADLHMVVGVVAGVHRDDGRRGTPLGEHVDEDQVDIVDPVEGRVAAGVEACLGEHVNASVGRLEVGVQLVVDVFVRVDVGDGRLVRVRVGCDLDLVAETVPVCALAGQLSSRVEFS